MSLPARYAPLADQAVTALEIEGFRQFRSVHLQFPSRLTVIAGPNGAGKTSVLDAIAALYVPAQRAFLQVARALIAHNVRGVARNFVNDMLVS